jgi:hypothetical protein
VHFAQKSDCLSIFGSYLVYIFGHKKYGEQSRRPTFATRAFAICVTEKPVFSMNIFFDALPVQKRIPL